MVIVTDFLTGVLSAIVIYALLYRFLDRPVPPAPGRYDLPPVEEVAAAYGQTAAQYDHPPTANGEVSHADGRAERGGR